MAFERGDRVSWGDGRTGTVVEKPRKYDRTRGDSFTGVGMVVREDYFGHRAAGSRTIINLDHSTVTLQKGD